MARGFTAVATAGVAALPRMPRDRNTGRAQVYFRMRFRRGEIF